jgi:hypothetical protein
MMSIQRGSAENGSAVFRGFGEKVKKVPCVVACLLVDSRRSRENASHQKTPRKKKRGAPHERRAA